MFLKAYIFQYSKEYLWETILNKILRFYSSSFSRFLLSLGYIFISALIILHGNFRQILISVFFQKIISILRAGMEMGDGEMTP